MAREYFPGDVYTTPEGVPHALSEYLLLGSRWSVYIHFIGTILRSRALSLAGAYDDEAWAYSSREIISNLERCRARFRIEGMDRVRGAEGPLVFVSNHMSTLETVALPGLIVPMKPVTYVVKEKLMHGFFWGPIMRSRNPIPVSRSDPRADLEIVMREGSARLAAGISVIIFPQGTRTEVFDRYQVQQPRGQARGEGRRPAAPRRREDRLLGFQRHLPRIRPDPQGSPDPHRVRRAPVRGRARQSRARAVPGFHRVAPSGLGGSGPLKRFAVIETRLTASALPEQPPFPPRSIRKKRKGVDRKQ